jgi:hypothetical protein
LVTRRCLPNTGKLCQAGMRTAAPDSQRAGPEIVGVMLGLARRAKQRRQRPIAAIGAETHAHLLDRGSQQCWPLHPGHI